MGSQEDRLRAQRMKRQRSRSGEVILGVGGEGGGVNVSRTVLPDGSARFAASHSEALFDDEGGVSRGRDLGNELSEPAFEQLDQVAHYWSNPALHLTRLHPDFEEAVLAALSARLDQAGIQAWRGKIDSLRAREERRNSRAKEPKRKPGG